MFDFAWSELALIGGVALILIGPKDLPVAIKAVSDMVKKARRMAGEFQTHVDEMVRDANLQEVKSTFDDLRRMDIKGKILNAVDGDGGLRRTIHDTKFDLNPAPPPVPVADTAPALPGAAPFGPDAALAPSADPTTDPGAAPTTDPSAAPESAAPEPAAPEPAAPRPPPAFIPPAIAAAGPPGPARPPPAFVPPAFALQAETVRRAAIPFA